jgi:tRNA-2-methylthio-N6-dimethylallyladenosine synthase
MTRPAAATGAGPAAGRRTYFLRTFGCQMNEHDSERIRAMLEAEGLRRVERPDDAGVLLYNTCTVRQSADERLAGHLGTAARLKREDPNRVVVVTGCLPQAEQAAFFARFPFVDVALGPQSLDRLPEALRGDRVEPRGFFADEPLLSGRLPGRRERSFQAWLQVMAGCTNFCSYCIVPFVRGPERSRPLPELVAEAEALVADGVIELTLLGQNVNAYGADFAAGREGRGAPTFAGLLRALDAIEGLARVRFMTSHPKDLSDELIAAIAELPTVCEHLHLPAQSGSDRVLAAMNRGYTRARYLERVRALRAAVPDVALTTDLIAGFPGESDQDFKETLSLVEEARFDAAFTFVYSPRAGTAAAAMTDQVPEDVRRARVERLIAATQAQARARHERLIGRSFEVLVEGRSRHGQTLRGRTRQHVTVNFTGKARPGELVTVTVTGATSTTLAGRI